jgi:hypothetical protein
MLLLLIPLSTIVGEIRRDAPVFTLTVPSGSATRASSKVFWVAQDSVVLNVEFGVVIVVKVFSRRFSIVANGFLVATNWVPTRITRAEIDYSVDAIVTDFRLWKVKVKGHKSPVLCSAAVHRFPLNLFEQNKECNNGMR